MAIQDGVSEKSKMFFYSGNKKENLFFYPLSAGHFFCDAQYKIERDNFNSILVMFVVKGRFSFVSEGRQFVAGRSELALVDCFQAHRYAAETDSEAYWIHIGGANTYSLYRELVERSGNVIACTEETEKLLQDIYERMKNGSLLSDSEMSLMIYRLLIGLFLSAKAGDGDVLTQSIRYISANFDRRLTVEQIADSVHMSASQFSRIFKKRIGSSPYDYLLNVRLTKAKELLKNTSLPISEIAYRTGFASDSNFICFFKNKEGISPLKFRRILY